MPATVPVESVMSKRPVQSRMPAAVPVESLMSKRPGQSGMPVTVPVESGRVRRRRVFSSKAPIKPKVSSRPQTTRPKNNHALYTPMAEVRENYETLLSLLKPVAIKADRGDISQTSGQSRSAPKPSGLPTARYTVSPESIDELLDEILIRDSTTACPSSESIDELLNELVISNSTTARQSSSRFVLDLSDLPLTPYRVSSSFIDDMLNSLVIRGKTLKRI